MCDTGHAGCWVHHRGSGGDLTAIFMGIYLLSSMVVWQGLPGTQVRDSNSRDRLGPDNEPGRAGTTTEDGQMECFLSQNNVTSRTCSSVPAHGHWQS